MSKVTREEMAKVYGKFNDFFEMPVVKDDTADDTMDAKIREAAAGLTDQDTMDDEIQGILVKMGIKFPGQTVPDAPVEEVVAEAPAPAMPEWLAIVAAAKELNESADLGLDPKIQTVGKKKDFVVAAVKAAGALLKAGDKITDDTRNVLVGLGVQVPEAAPAKKKERKAVEKKEKAPAPPKKLPGTTFIVHLVCDNPNITKEEVLAALQSNGYATTEGTVAMQMTDTLKAVNYLKEKGRLVS